MLCSSSSFPHLSGVRAIPLHEVCIDVRSAICCKAPILHMAAGPQSCDLNWASREPMILALGSLRLDWLDWLGWLGWLGRLGWLVLLGAGLAAGLAGLASLAGLAGLGWLSGALPGTCHC